MEDRLKTEGSLITPISSNQLPAGSAQAEQKRFRSILFPEPISISDIDTREAPEFFIDLNLDQIVASITAGRDEYNLKPFFYTPLKNVDAIYYRYEVLRDLDNVGVFECIRSFADSMRSMRSHLFQAEKLYYKRQKQAWFLDAVEVYCNAVRQLGADLAGATLRSRGFQAFHDFLRDYSDSPRFLSLAGETEKLKTDLSGIRYSLQIHGKRIKAAKYNSEPDYSAEVLEIFNKFKQGAPREYRFEFHSTADMNHVEAAVLDLVAQLFPETFSFLDEYCNRHSGFLDATIAGFDREVQFYMACVEYAARFKQAGLSLCHPALSDHSKEIYARDAFDLALANRLVQDKTPVVTNDLHLKTPERIFIVSGPNQGGKTTFARMFGQLHYLASIGCPVPAREAKLFLFDQLFTHFEREEELRNLTGKLEDELLRIRRILERASPRSILIMNESFLSTTLDDALFLSKQIMERIIALDVLCVSVTFLDELASLGKTTVSMVSTVNPEDPVLRTFKIIRRPADGLAYAAAIAEKHRLTYRSVKARVAKNAEERPAT
jgi:DNA mismatch repair protein MutS